jgi:moderate conductance mechanosensitive channel
MAVSLRCLALLSFLSVFLLVGGQAWPGIQKDVGKTPTEIQEVEKIVRLLEDPQEAKKLASQLRVLIEASKPRPPEEKEKAAPEKDAYSPGLEKFHRLYEEQIISGIKGFLSAVRKVPVRMKQVKDYLGNAENYPEIKSFAIPISIAFFAGLMVWFLLRVLTWWLEKKWQAKEPAGMPAKTKKVLLETFVGIYPWIGVLVIFFALSWFLPTEEELDSILSRGLWALVIFVALKRILYFLLSPEAGEHRILPLREDVSAYVYIWSRRILLFSLWAYLLYMPSSILQFASLKIVLSIFFQTGLALFAAVILAQWKDSIRERLRFSFREGDSPARIFGKKALNLFTANLHILGIGYVAFWVILSFSGFSRAQAFFLSSSWKTALVLLLALGFWRLWKYLFAKLFEISQVFKERYPELEERVNRYIHYLGKAGYAFIALLTALTVLDVWGVRMYSLFTANISLVQSLLRIPTILLLAFLLIQVGSFLITKFAGQAKLRMLAASNVPPIELEKRVSTLAKIFQKAFTVVVLSFAAITILSELGFDIKPLLAGAGIVGLAVGFGAQNLVRDVISGLFFTFENRIRVGDVAVLNGTGGLVEQVNLRTTVLRGLDGTIHVFPNGSINTLSNMTYEFSYYLFNMGVAYKEDTDRVIEVLKQVAEEVMQEEDYRAAILEPLEILGVDQFADSAVIIKARIKTPPIKQWLVGREMNRRIKKRFDELGIEIPFPHRSFYFGDASKAISVKLEGTGGNREEIKSLIREILNEQTGLKR